MSRSMKTRLFGRSAPLASSRPDGETPSARRRFLRDRRGNIAITAGVLAGPLIAATGGAVDFMHFMTIRSEIQGALDTGVLAAASLSNSRPAQLVIADYLTSNLDPGIVDPDRIAVTVTSERSLNTATVIVTADYSFEPVFLGLFGVRELPVSVSVGGTQSVQEVEISMVLDISGSMAGDKIASLKDAAKEFIDTVLQEEVRDATSVSIIPFNGTVHLPDAFDAFVEPAELADHAGCMELDHWNAATFAFNGDDYHYTYEDGSSEEDDDRTNNEKSGASWSNAYHQSIPEYYHQGETYCPGEDMEAIFLQNDPDLLKGRIDDFVAAGYTGMDVGAMIGLIGLDPSFKSLLGGVFPDRPSAFGAEVLKVLIIMTDGELTQQPRPKIVLEDRNTVLNQRIPELDNNRNQRVRISTNEGRNQFYGVCNHAKDDQVLIFTIGFQIDTGKWSHQALGDCPQNESQYYFVEDLDIKAAFNSIAASINNLRLTK